MSKFDRACADMAKRLDKLVERVRIKYGLSKREAMFVLMHNTNWV